MPVLETILTVVAPHTCVSCGVEGSLLCSECSVEITSVPSRCYHCRKLTDSFRTCESCRGSSKLRRVSVRAQYGDVPKGLVHKLKFERARAAATTLASLMSKKWGNVSTDTLLVHVPTATSRRRQRGYDQAELLAKELKRLTGVKRVSLLCRLGQQRQVGHTRKQRLEQLSNAFYVSNPKKVIGRDILLVDDVLTTGATLEAAANVLRRAGARHVDAIVFAQA